MKWFFIVLVCAISPVALVRGDAAADLFTKGDAAMDSGDYKTAADAFDQIIKGYNSVSYMDEVRVRAGLSYFNLGDYTNALERLSKSTGENAARSPLRITALYYQGLSQFLQGGKLTADAERNAMFAQAVTSFTTLIDLINASTKPEDKDLLEDVLYYRASAQLQREGFDAAEKDLQQLVKDFPASLGRPDYLLRLGNVYAIQADKARLALKPGESPDKVRDFVNKALQTFDRAAHDPNALVQANEANMLQGNIYSGILVPLDSSPADDYTKAINFYRLVRSKDDLIGLQQKRLDELKLASQLQASNAGLMATENARIIERERSRLTTLKDKDEPDPVVDAMINMAKCYNGLKEGDEARTLLRRVVAHTTPRPDQKQEIDFQMIFSYVLSNQNAKADAALSDYLAKHPNDKSAEGISFNIARNLYEQKDYEGTLKQLDRSLKDFPQGAFVPYVISLKAQALTNLGRLDAAAGVVDDYLKQNPNSPVALNMMLTQAQAQAAQGKNDAALVSYQKIRDNPTATPAQAATAAVGHIQAQLALHKYDDVISEAKAFATKYPDNVDLPTVLYTEGLALDQKNDPTGITLWQDLAKKYPKSDSASRALFGVMRSYQKAGKVPEMTQAAESLRQSYPEAYPLLALAAEAVGKSYLDDRKFDLALAEYKPLADAPQSDVAAAAHNKMGTIWIASAKTKKNDDPATAEKEIGNAESEFLATLKKYPDQLNALGDAFQGLTDAMLQRRSLGLLKDADLENYLSKLGADLTTPEMQARLELAKAGLVFSIKEGDKQYPAALDRFKKVVEANPDLKLTRREADQFGELLIAGGDYDRAIQVYTDLLNRAAATDTTTQADANYGIGAAYLAKGDVAQAKTYFDKMKTATWHPHILNAQYGLAQAAEKAGDAATAKQIYASLMTSSRADYRLQAQATLSYGRVLEKSGKITKASNQQDTDYAIYSYHRVDGFWGGTVPLLSAEGLFLAGQAEEKVGDKPGAKADYTKLIEKYGKTAPEWAAKAQTALGKLGI